jgi:hypothetical protein
MSEVQKTQDEKKPPLGGAVSLEMGVFMAELYRSVDDRSKVSRLMLDAFGTLERVAYLLNTRDSKAGGEAVEGFLAGPFAQLFIDVQSALDQLEQSNAVLAEGPGDVPKDLLLAR